MSYFFKYGLEKKDIINIKNVFSKYKEVEEVLIYGSRAKGNYRPGSDIDLTLKNKQINLKILNKISNSLDDLFLPYIFDLSIYHQIKNNSLIDHIHRVGKVFYKK